MRGTTWLLACAVVASCWRDDRGTIPIPSRIDPAPRDLSGAYWCAIDDSAGFEAVRYPCVIRKVRGRFILAKLGGTHRFQGIITAMVDDGFAFSGVFFCPWGECSHALHGAFKPTAHAGELRGTFRDDMMVVTLSPAPQDAFGGIAYGGDGYGDPFGKGFGGGAYGGYTYVAPSPKAYQP
jgi:hypothetical protein